MNPEIHQLLKRGAIVVIGEKCQEFVAQMIKSGVTEFLIPRERANDLQLPTVRMQFCILLFLHYLPAKEDALTEEDLALWESRLLSDIDFGQNMPAVKLVASNEGCHATLSLHWRGQVDAGLCVRAARELEKACVANGGRM